MAEVQAVDDTNAAYVEHVTSTAFNLTLSKNMINALLLMDAGASAYDKVLQGVQVPALSALARRGLLRHHWTGPDNPAWFITKEGQLVAELLRRAGFGQMSDHQGEQ
jgi:sarcosine oxidase gamma subunit